MFTTFRGPTLHSIRGNPSSVHDQYIEETNRCFVPMNNHSNLRKTNNASLVYYNN